MLIGPGHHDFDEGRDDERRSMRMLAYVVALLIVTGLTFVVWRLA